MKSKIKVAITSFLSLILCVHGAFGSPLVFKVSKKIDSKELVELATFDASKLGQIRIGLKFLTIDGQIPISKDTAERELAIAQNHYERTSKLFRDGLASKSNVESASERLKAAKVAFDTAFKVEIVGLVENEEILVLEINERNFNNSPIIESPPSNLRIKVSGKGIFSLYVWGN